MAVKVLKVPVPGGMLTLTNQELILGEGLLGARNVRQFKLNWLARLDVVPSPRASSMRPNKLLRFVWMSGDTTEVDGVGPAAAQRVQCVVHALRRPTMRQYVA